MRERCFNFILRFPSSFSFWSAARTYGMHNTMYNTMRRRRRRRRRDWEDHEALWYVVATKRKREPRALLII